MILRDWHYWVIAVASWFFSACAIHYTILQHHPVIVTCGNSGCSAKVTVYSFNLLNALAFGSSQLLFGFLVILKCFTTHFLEWFCGSGSFNCSRDSIKSWSHTECLLQPILSFVYIPKHTIPTTLPPVPASLSLFFHQHCVYQIYLTSIALFFVSLCVSELLLWMPKCPFVNQDVPVP